MVRDAMRNGKEETGVRGGGKESPPAPVPEEPGFWYSFGAVAMVVAILLVGTLAFGAPIQLLLLFSMVALMPVVMVVGYSFEEVQGFAHDAIRGVLNLMMILVAVGALIGAWSASGTTPALVRAGLDVISPAAFLPVTLLVCMVASLATGTSWGTVGTVGVAMMAVGDGFGYPLAMTAGAIVSGAYFGDKMSPFSDSTNLSAALVEVDLIAHIRYLMWTTVPAILAAAAVFTFLGLHRGASADGGGRADALSAALEEPYRSGFAVFIPVVVVLVLLALRQPPFPSVLMGALSGAAVAVLHQGESVTDVLEVLYSGFAPSTGDELADTLLGGGGVESMLGVVALFMFAVGMAGLLNRSGMVLSLVRPAMRLVTNRRRLMVASVVLVPLFVALGASFSFAAVMAASLLVPVYDRFDLDRRNLSRIIEDTGTVNDPTFPWSSGGVFVAGVLGVATFAYFPYYFFGLFSMVMSLFIAVTGLTVRKAPYR